MTLRVHVSLLIQTGWSRRPFVGIVSKNLESSSRQQTACASLFRSTYTRSLRPHRTASAQVCQSAPCLCKHGSASLSRLRISNVVTPYLRAS